MAGKGQGERSGLGHVVLVEVRYKSVKNHLNCQNSCGESGAVRGGTQILEGGTPAAPLPPPHLSQWCRSLSLSLSRCRSCSRFRSEK